MPRVAAVLSAWGMLATDLRFEVSRTHIGDTRSLDGADLRRLFDDMEAEGLARLRASFDGPARTSRAVDMRYGEQVFEITVPLDEVDWRAADPLPDIVERFHRRHEELYTYSMRDQETVLVNARVAVSGILSALPQEPLLPEIASAAPRAERRIWLDDVDRGPGLRFRGACSRANDRRPRNRRIRNDHCPAAPRRARHRHAVRLARCRSRIAGVRHHPGELVVMAFAVGLPAAAVGLSPFVIGLYATLNLAVQFFAHANIGLPRRLANALGWLLVTPVLHRVHHSRHPADISANYGLVFSVWDRLFGTYRGDPEYGDAGIEFGVDRLRDSYYQRLDRMLWLPLIVRGSGS